MTLTIAALFFLFGTLVWVRTQERGTQISVGTALVILALVLFLAEHGTKVL